MSDWAAARPRLRSSIRNKLTFLFFAVTAGAMLIVYFYVVPQLESNLTSQKIDALEREATINNGRFVKTAAKRDLSITEIESATTVTSQLTSSRVTLYAFQSGPGNRPYILSDSRDVGTKVDPSRALVERVADTGRTASATSARGRELAQVAKPVKVDGQVYWVTVYSQSLVDVADNVSLIQRQILVAAVIALTVAVLAGYFFSSILARRVKRLERAAKDIAAGRFSTPITVDSEDELGELARAFSDMQRQLARVDDARKEFIANASHELRTPIFSLGGFVELLQDEDLDEPTRDEFLATMSEQVARLQKLTTDLLDLSRLDAGSLELELEPVPLRLLAREVAAEFTASATQHESSISVLDGDLDDTGVEAACDRNRVEQILRVLLDNAIVHTEGGTVIAIEAREGDANEGRAVAELSVRDNGQGVESRDLPYLFERFHSGSASGSGLGLAIAHELAERMNGTLEVESKAGETVFTLTLPLAGEWIPPAPREHPQGAAGTEPASRSHS